ncbi:MAG: AAA family ATPase [Phycisphaerae bacterium]|nr:AAA family ATPase [Phycisphaerae bacterium]
MARGCTTLLTGGWKSGKTTLVSDLVRDLTLGGPLSESTKGVKVLIVSEEGPLLWKRRVTQRGLSDLVMFICRPFTRRAQQGEWEEFLESVRDDAVRLAIDLVIVDTLSTLWPPDDENDAAKVQRALMPLTDLLEAGIALLLINHPKKGESDDGMSSRGSGALPSWVDCIVEFKRASPHDIRNPQRVLKALSRFDETPKEMLLDRGESGYRWVGEIASNSTPERLEVIQRLLETSGKGLTAEEVESRWPGAGKPSGKSIAKLMSDGAKKGHWELASKGARGRPACYRHRASDDSSHSDPLKGGKNHSDAPGGEVAS